jgi:type IV pilus assembly protein PilO
MKITSLQKTIALAVAFVLVAILAVVLVVLPMRGQLTELEAQKVSAQADLARAQALLSQLESAKSRSAATEASLLKIGTQMPDSPQLPTLIVELQNIANDAGVTVTSFAPAEPAPASGGKYTEIPMTTAVTAEWDDLLDYLRRLDSSTRLVRVTNVSISQGSVDTTTTSSETPLSVSLSMKAYVIGTNGVLSSGSVATSGTTTP